MREPAAATHREHGHHIHRGEPAAKHRNGLTGLDVGDMRQRVRDAGQPVQLHPTGTCQAVPGGHHGELGHLLAAIGQRHHRPAAGLPHVGSVGPQPVHGQPIRCFGQQHPRRPGEVFTEQPAGQEVIEPDRRVA